MFSVGRNIGYTSAMQLSDDFSRALRLAAISLGRDVTMLWLENKLQLITDKTALAGALEAGAEIIQHFPGK